jgi:outer membrane protein assembly factor BamB
MMLSLGCTLLFGVGGDATPSADWPRWRGPTDTGEAAATANPPAEWSETKNVKWKVKIPGNGSSTPIVLGDRVYLTTAIESEGSANAAPSAKEPPPKKAPPEGEPGKGFGKKFGKGKGGFGGMNREKPSKPVKFVALALDRATGKTIWTTPIREEVPHEGHHRDHGFASFSPLTDGNRLYVYFGSRGLHCLTLDGKIEWSKELGKMQTRAGFGEGSTPNLHGDVIVVTWDHEGEDFIVAYDKRNGNELWRKPRDEPTTWSTPFIAVHGGKPQVIAPGTNKCVSYDLKSGEIVWECPGLTTNAIPSPVGRGDMVYLTSGFRGAALYAIRLGSTGNLSGTEAMVWKHAKNTPYVPSPALVGERLYFFSGNNNVLSVFDVKTGKPVIDAERVEGLQGVYASPVAAGGKVYLVGRNGAAVVLEAGDKVKVLAKNRLPEGIDASPAVAGNQLFLRGKEHLYCIAEK